MSQHRFQRADGSVTTYERDDLTRLIRAHGPLSDTELAEIIALHEPTPQWSFGKEDFYTLIVVLGRVADAVERVAGLMESTFKPSDPVE